MKLPYSGQINTRTKLFNDYPAETPAGYTVKTLIYMVLSWTYVCQTIWNSVITLRSFRWSFGVCLWEIFTLGGAPYPGIPTEQLLDFLSEGHRMEQPHNCPLDMYTIMRDCWEQNPDIRPTFVQLSERIGRILELHASKVMNCRDTEQTG